MIVNGDIKSNGTLSGSMSTTFINGNSMVGFDVLLANLLLAAIIR